MAARRKMQEESLTPGRKSDGPGLVQAFTADQVVRLTGLSRRQLAYWDRTGFFRPEYAADARGGAYERIYSFKDVVGLRTLAVLRSVHGVSMPHLKKVAAELAGYSEAPWAEIRLKVWNRRVVFAEPETGRDRGVVDGQYVLLSLVEVMEDVRNGIAALKRRRLAEIGRIERHRHVAHNAPVLAGTRVPVRTVLRFIEDGYSPAEILREFPSLTEADIAAAAAEGRGAHAA